MATKKATQDDGLIVVSTIIALVALTVLGFGMVG